MVDQVYQIRNRTQKQTNTQKPTERKKQQTSHLDQSSAPYELGQPDRSGPSTKTLYEIAAERQAELEKDGFYARNPPPPSKESNAQFFSSSEDDEPIGPFGEAAVYSISLAMVHFTLDVMVFHQYRQEVDWSAIWAKTLKMLPALFFVVYMLHSKTVARFAVFKQLIFLITSIAAGCFLIRSGNREGYYAVMKKAPPVGTLWVWSVVEMRLEFALAHAVIIFGYVWWNGYGTF